MGEREAKLNVTKALASKGWVEDEVSGDWPCREGQYADSKGDAVDGKGHKTTGSYPVHEPGHAGVGHHERNHESQGEHAPLIPGDLRHSDGVLALAHQRFQKRVPGRDHHGWHGQEEREFEGGGPRYSGQLSGSNRRHGARCSWKYG